MEAMLEELKFDINFEKILQNEDERVFLLSQLHLLTGLLVYGG